MGCCLYACLASISVRLLLFYGWFAGWYAVFDSSLAAVLGWVFLPWTSLAFMYFMFHGGTNSLFAC